MRYVTFYKTFIKLNSWHLLRNSALVFFPHTHTEDVINSATAKHSVVHFVVTASSFGCASSEHCLSCCPMEGDIRLLQWSLLLQLFSLDTVLTSEAVCGKNCYWLFLFLGMYDMYLQAVFPTLPKWQPPCWILWSHSSLSDFDLFQRSQSSQKGKKTQLVFYHQVLLIQYKLCVVHTCYMGNIYIYTFHDVNGMFPDLAKTSVWVVVFGNHAGEIVELCMMPAPTNLYTFILFPAALIEHQGHGENEQCFLDRYCIQTSSGFARLHNYMDIIRNVAL